MVVESEQRCARAAAPEVVLYIGRAEVGAAVEDYRVAGVPIRNAVLPSELREDLGSSRPPVNAFWAAGIVAPHSHFMIGGLSHAS